MQPAGPMLSVVKPRLLLIQSIDSVVMTRALPAGTVYISNEPPVDAVRRNKFGAANLYAECGVPCLPVALNSGLFWPRRTFRRYPGTVRLVALFPIAPGLPREEFFERMSTVIEDASRRLIAEGRHDLDDAHVVRPPDDSTETEGDAAGNGSAL